jgi:hypothetical protein
MPGMVIAKGSPAQHLSAGPGPTPLMPSLVSGQGFPAQQPSSPPGPPDPPPSMPRVVKGQGAPTVTIPRIEASVEIDGRLDEPAWSQAVRLAGFSQYRPVDSRPAEEQTEVLIWYSPTALHFGIIARDRQPGSIRATVADRDNLSRDDTVSIYLDTFNDRRRAFFFGVNPLGAQEDGVQSEGAFNAGTMYGGTIDRNPDYQFDSKGRITEDGYIVEVRIPFKSLRYPSSSAQKWGLNILRKVQRTGYEDTWTDARRANSSFLTQAGAIDGLHDLKRGMVTEVQPFMTTASNGSLGAGGAFTRDTLSFEPGVNLRLGFTSTSIDATINPDFSQVESDASQVTQNQRFALFYAEKRPFFLEGIELFATPNQLVYTRQIVNPLVGAKFTGKVGSVGIAYLVARDDSPSGNAFFNVARVRKDLGKNSLAGFTYTDRTTASGYNRVAAADARVVFGTVYYVQGQIGRSWSGQDGRSTSAPVWLAEFDRTGRAWGFNHKLSAFGSGFSARSGYVPRNDIVDFHSSNRFSLYGARGALLEQFTIFFGPSRIWRYGWFPGATPLEGSDSANLNFQMRGGWTARANFKRDFVRFDSGMYTGYQVAHPNGTIEPFRQDRGLSGMFGATISVTTPILQRVNGQLEVQRTSVAIFPEAAAGEETRVTGTVALRPTGSIRIEATTTMSSITRKRDGSEFGRTIIPRVKAEYQPKRALFFRVIAEYRNQRQAALEEALTGDGLVIGGVPSTPTRIRGLRVDWLVSFEPTPGTVAFFGYGSSLEGNAATNYSVLRRTSDGFFVKLAYQFRR